jgi:hypothetical protein
MKDALSFRATQTARNLALEGLITRFSMREFPGLCEVLRLAQGDSVGVLA